VGGGGGGDLLQLIHSGNAEPYKRSGNIQIGENVIIIAKI
jgi:hypothetical protein